ncbi:uncharacterized protein J4E87_007570 [Alternaria ethzedia]|uniref:uncharacterized protein n=1 Tax=Alternaria ethzedia TaxID=181014 RepID=UPI0020C53888|nr:uncharacterized protein J4E87_007570 [Alternaria ethzedia]KAI4619320.1 hypothetical protein J4E87_007570 [Alternaria ethzedia]
MTTSIEPDWPGLLKISTDGSSFRNGKADAAAGVGVFFGVSDPRNVGAPLGPGPQTNQRAELMAIKIALEKVSLSQDVLIRSDSKYAIQCVTKWHRGWKMSSWNKQEGEYYEHMDVIESVVIRKQLRKNVGAKTKFFWVKGHIGDAGNEAADKLASRGSKRTWFDRPENKKNKRESKGIPRAADMHWVRGRKVVKRPDGQGEELVQLTAEELEIQLVEWKGKKFTRTTVVDGDGKDKTGKNKTGKHEIGKNKVVKKTYSKKK